MYSGSDHSGGEDGERGFYGHLFCLRDSGVEVFMDRGTELERGLAADSRNLGELVLAEEGGVGAREEEGLVRGLVEVADELAGDLRGGDTSVRGVVESFDDLLAEVMREMCAEVESLREHIQVPGCERPLLPLGV